jgi:hypothetical protein
MQPSNDVEGAIKDIKRRREIGNALGLEGPRFVPLSVAETLVRAYEATEATPSEGRAALASHGDLRRYRGEMVAQLMEERDALVAELERMKAYCRDALRGVDGVMMMNNWAMVPESGLGLAFNALHLALGTTPWQPDANTGGERDGG